MADLPYRLEERESKTTSARAVRRRTIRNLAIRAALMMQPDDWPDDVEAEFLRLVDRLNMPRPSGARNAWEQPDPTPGEITVRKERIRLENLLNLPDPE